MTIRLRTVFFVFISIVVVWFVYVVRGILTPFILAAIFAYIFNPLVNFGYHKIKLPRTVSILFMYAILMGIVIFLTVLITRQIGSESMELRNYTSTLLRTTNDQIASLPDFIRPAAREWIVSFSQTRVFSAQSLVTVFPRAIIQIIDFLIFLFTAFYFLREGGAVFQKLLHFVPNDYKDDARELLRKINGVLSAYLRGELILVLIVSCMLFVALSILGMRFALIVAIFSGFAEIVPWVGPFVAGFVASLIIVLTGSANFLLTPMQGVISVVLIYFVIRMVEDYFIMPLVMGKIVRLHPTVLFLSVLKSKHFQYWDRYLFHIHTYRHTCWGLFYMF
jgi:predicted PurR-regulated permease PerM